MADNIRSSRTEGLRSHQIHECGNCGLLGGELAVLARPKSMADTKQSSTTKAPHEGQKCGSIGTPAASILPLVSLSSMEDTKQSSTANRPHSHESHGSQCGCHAVSEAPHIHEPISAAETKQSSATDRQGADESDGETEHEPKPSAKKKRRVSLLKVDYPVVFADLKPELNPNEDLDKLKSHSNKYLMFSCGQHPTCPNPHNYPAMLNNRTAKKPTGCPYCANSPHVSCDCLAPKRMVSRPDLMGEFDRKKNKVADPANLALGNNNCFWWICHDHAPCKKVHRWRATLGNRTSGGNGCPWCASGGVNKRSCKDCTKNLLSSRPALVAEIDVQKNADENIDTNVTLGSHRRLYWICLAKKHPWPAQVCDRDRGTGCPYCVRDYQRSTLEKACDAVLKDLGISALNEHKFADCKKKYALKWDYFISELGPRGVLIEMDGNQHFQPWEGHADNIPELAKIRARDKIKNDYARAHYDFLRVSWNSRKKIDEEVRRFIKDVQSATNTTTPIFRLIGKEYQTDEYKRLVL